MMKLSTMQDVVATVDDQWESPLADELLQHWEHDDQRAKYWRASANFVFFCKRSGQDHVLRFNHDRERSAAGIQAEVDYVKALAASHIRVARPIRSLSGSYVESIPTAQGVFHAVLFEALPGKLLELDELAPAQFGRWGQALGELHNAAGQYAKPGRPSWEKQLAWVSDILPVDEQVVLPALDRLKGQLDQLAINEQNYGLIHWDFELDNIVWDKGQPGIIDFDDSGWCWFVADIALALSDLFEDSAAQVDLQNESFLHFIEGYRRVRPMASEELKLIPLFLRMEHLINYAKLYRTLTPVNPSGELPWMAGLRSKLAAKMQFYREELSR